MSALLQTETFLPSKCFFLARMRRVTPSGLEILTQTHYMRPFNEASAIQIGASVQRTFSFEWNLEIL